MHSMFNRDLKKDFVRENAKNKQEEQVSVGTEIKLCPEAEKLFEVVDIGDGDESMAIKPYLAAIKEPKNHNPIN